MALWFLICGFELNEIYIKENTWYGISYQKDKAIDFIPTMLIIGKIVVCYTSKVTDTLYN